MDNIVKAKQEGVQQSAMSGVGVSGGWVSQAGNQALFSTSHSHTSEQQSSHLVPPPAHAHTASASTKLPESFTDKDFLEAAAYIDNKSMTLPVKHDPQATSESGSTPPWAIQNTLLHRYGQFMLDRLMTKPSTDCPAASGLQQTASSTNSTATVTTDALAKYPEQASTTHGPSTSLVSDRPPSTSLEAQRDAYRRMLNYSMSSAITQQYYLSQYGYNYPPDRQPLGRMDGPQINAPVSSPQSPPAPTATAAMSQSRAQLPSIDSVLLNLSTKKKVETTETVTTMPSHTSRNSNPPVSAYDGLQALANAAIEADPKAFSEAHGNGERKDNMEHKSHLDDITESDESVLSPSDSCTSPIMSPPRTTFTNIHDTIPHSIPSAHTQFSPPYPHKGGLGSLPGIQHFSALSGQPASKPSEMPSPMSMSHMRPSEHTSMRPSEHTSMRPSEHTSMRPSEHTSLRPSELAALKLKVETTEEEKEIADRTIQEQIAAHQLQQQVHELTASAIASGNIEAATLLSKLPMSGEIDPAALLAKMPLAGDVQAEFQRHMERVYEGYDPESIHSLQQQEPMELTADMIAGKATNSRRKSRGRPTSIESQRDPLGRQSSTSSLGGNTSLSGASVDGDDRTYDCDLCGKQFSHNDRLRRHRKIHTTEKPYKCDICGKGFKEKCNLKHHRYIHTGEKPYKCDTCGKSFNQRSSLKTHQKVHTGEKPFRCDLCEKPFAQKYLLRQHMKKHIELNVAAAAQQ